MRPERRRATIVSMRSTTAYPEVELLPAQDVLPDEETDDEASRRACRPVEKEPEAEGIFPGVPLS
jgi:hypothetical protein